MQTTSRASHHWNLAEQDSARTSKNISWRRRQKGPQYMPKPEGKLRIQQAVEGERNANKLSAFQLQSGTRKFERRTRLRDQLHQKCQCPLTEPLPSLYPAHLRFKRGLKSCKKNRNPMYSCPYDWSVVSILNDVIDKNTRDPRWFT